jgi:hypothetical protein
LINFTSIGIPEQLTKIIVNSYKEATIQMQTKQGFTYKITTGKGVKQGCPSSPSLFNLGIDSFIRNMKENDQEWAYNCDGQLRKVIQGYGDDLLVFADTREYISRWIRRFLKYVHINFNPKKCNLLIHNTEKEIIVPVRLPNEKGELQEVGICGIKDAIKYLGVR